MDSRFDAILAAQLASRFTGLTGSDARATLRISDQLLNEGLVAALPPDGVLRALTINAQNGNILGVAVTLRRPAFLPTLHARLAIERQPSFPDDPVLGLRITGGSAGLLKFAGGMLGTSIRLPPGVRLQDEVVLVDLRAAFAARGLSQLLDYATEVRVTAEDGATIVQVSARVPSG